MTENREKEEASGYRRVATFGGWKEAYKEGEGIEGKE